jgi:polyferredoxin/Flp pilus assembly protein TadD
MSNNSPLEVAHRAHGAVARADCRPRTVSLPVINGAGGLKPRPSRRGRWRAAVLLAVHALIAAHITHAALSERTVSPVEPSEAMYTLELGWVNAGAIFLAVSLLGTLLFGRFFCGWGCHLVALQDLCGWIMRRLGVRPRAFRSRLLVWLPAGLAVYLFAWPTFLRWWLPASAVHPGFSNHLLTTDFWATFPGPVMAALTFVVCGFAAVYLLGAKGFCTYGCPYGALFVAVDRASPARIVVSDACNGCGHCTATCTSNVRVHEEVKQHGMVVDSGCMKCMDCVSVCPTQALSFGYAYPPVLRKTPVRAAARPYDLSVRQEVVAAFVCVASLLAFRGLYDGPPLLLAGALGALTAFVVFKGYALVTAPDVSLQNLRLKTGNRLRAAGWVFAVLALAWLGFTVHSGFVQYNRAEGRYYLEQTGVTWEEVRTTTAKRLPRSEQEREAAQRAYVAYAAADQWGLVDVGEVKLGLAWLAILRDDPADAERQLRAAVRLYPRSPRHRQHLAEFLAWRGRLPEAVAELEARLALIRPNAEEHFRLAGLLVEVGRRDDAIAHYRACLVLEPSSLEANYNLGAVLRRAGRAEEAIGPLGLAHWLSPQDSQTALELCLAYAELGWADAAREVIRRASPAIRQHLEREPRLRDLLRPKPRR